MFGVEEPTWLDEGEDPDALKPFWPELAEEEVDDGERGTEEIVANLQIFCRFEDCCKCCWRD